MQTNTVAQFATELKLAPQVLLEQLRASLDNPLVGD